MKNWYKLIVINRNIVYSKELCVLILSPLMKYLVRIGNVKEFKKNLWQKQARCTFADQYAVPCYRSVCGPLLQISMRSTVADQYAVHCCRSVCGPLLQFSMRSTNADQYVVHCCWSVCGPLLQISMRSTLAYQYAVDSESSSPDLKFGLIWIRILHHIF